MSDEVNCLVAAPRIAMEKSNIPYLIRQRSFLSASVFHALRCEVSPAMFSCTGTAEPDLTYPSVNVDNSNPARRRTRNACDACRARRIKCHYEGRACRACNEAQIPCTQDKPRRKRGPVNQYVEAQRRKEKEQHGFTPTIQQQQPDSYASTTHTGAPASPATLGFEELAEFATIEHVLTDWFELVHPVAPIVHRDTFLRHLQDAEASQSPGFVNLVFSLCAATVATLRRRSSAYGMITVERCYELARHNEIARAQTDDALSNINLEWCQTKYNFAVSLSAIRGMDNPVSQMLMAEATTGTGYLLHYAADSQPFLNQELLKRLHWLCFAGQCTQGLHNRPGLAFIGPSLSSEALRPLEITDAELATITPGQEHWHGNVTSYIPGLNALSNLFMLWFKSQQGDRIHDLTHLQHHMELVLRSLDDIPPELRWRGGLSRPMRSNFGTDVQTVNLYITQIHIRSFLLDQMDRAATEIGDTSTATWVLNARQSLVDDMLAIVYQMPEDTLEANGYSLIPKLRDIGLALLSENAGDSVKTLVNLDRLLTKLERLDVPPGSRFDTTSPSTSMTTAI